ncbi:MAG: DUF3048 domain-containing protein [Promicromonosporaceae bacterium]|nr:DUF3048 domain-containing protein [Promicromonosporaceae bacterium]
MSQPRNLRRRFASGALIAALPLTLALALSGCTNAALINDVPVVTETVEPAAPAPDVTEETPVTEEPATEDTYAARWPLTGMGTDAVADRPALLVKVENSAAARPQTGLEFADIVYEQVVEGGMTRYVAVYHSQLPDQILPVRSARPTDVPIVTPYGGIFAYSGAQAAFIQAINNAGNQSLIFDSGAPGLFRVGDRPAPHNVAGDPEVLLAQANASRVSPPNSEMEFAPSLAQSTAVTEGTDVSNLAVRMSSAFTANYQWDPATQTFLRSDGTAPSMSSTGERLSATNVVLVAADITMSTLPGASAVPETILQGSGRAIFAAGGKYIEGTWQKGGNADTFTFLDANGYPVQFAPGNTWIQLVPNGSGGWTLS